MLEDDATDSLAEDFDGPIRVVDFGVSSIPFPTEFTIETDDDPAPKKNEIPFVVLATIGLGVFDAVIGILYLALWSISPTAILSIAHALAGVTLLCGVAPVVLGGLVYHKNKESGKVTPGTQWVVMPILAGVALCFLTLLLPVATAFRIMLGAA